MFVGLNWPEPAGRIEWSGSNNTRKVMGSPLPNLSWPYWPCPRAPGPEMVPVLSLRPDKQEMAVVSHKKLSSFLRDDFVWMGVGGSVGRQAAEILTGASLGSGSMGKEGRGRSPTPLH